MSHHHVIQPTIYTYIRSFNLIDIWDYYLLLCDLIFVIIIVLTNGGTSGIRKGRLFDYMMDKRHKTSKSGQILTRQHFLLLVYVRDIRKLHFVDIGVKFQTLLDH